MKYRYCKQKRGFTLLIAVLVVGIVLAIGLSILNITLKEYLLSGVARESTIALNAADAGMECALYWDRSSQGNKFDLGPPAGRRITCMGTTWNISQGVPGTIGSGDAQRFDFTWGISPDPIVCAKIVVTKYFSGSGTVDMGVGLICPMGVVCTRIESRGYNKACADIATPRTVERGLRTRY